MNIATSDDLAEQRWGIIAAIGPRGDHLLDLIAPLRRKREEEQGAEVVVYRVAPEMTPTVVASWIAEEYSATSKYRIEGPPRYLLLLGDADTVSWELQQLLAAHAFVGRLAFTNDLGYERYVDKILQWECERSLADASALYYTARDGSSAMESGYRDLVVPCMNFARDLQAQKKLAVSRILEIGGGELHRARVIQVPEFVTEVGKARGSILFSLSHGFRSPAIGWRSAEEKLALQGAMALNRRGDLLTARDVKEQAFLPGGVWLNFSCHGAGTRGYNANLPWNIRLYELGFEHKPTARHDALPNENPRPFVAALPRAALANPDGPLGIVSHVDDTSSECFLDFDWSNPYLSKPENRYDRFHGMLQALLEGHRFGVAHNQLARFSLLLSIRILAIYDEAARRNAGIVYENQSTDYGAMLAFLWRQRQDIGNFVLLGDPAARLHVARSP